MFLSPTELDNIAKWQYKVTDNSITTKFYKNFWYLCESYISPKISPNLISFSGFFLILSNYIISTFYYNEYPILVGLYVALATQICCHLDSIDGIHARNTKTSSPLGELVDHICDTIGLIFIILSFCNIFNITDIDVKTFTTLSGMLGFQFFHIQAYIYKGVEFGRYTGPIELLSLYSIIILAKTFGLVNESSFNDLISLLSPYVFVLIFCGNVYYVIEKFNNYMCMQNIIILLILYFIILLSIIFSNYNMYYLFNLCFNVCVLTKEFILSKLCNKNLPYFLIVLFIISQISNILGICFSLYYIFTSLKSIANHMNLNLLYHNLKE
jgi:phosphatidylglycerophosphate synthase